jgi:2-phospho-L-lactate guanylyltransferase (CobY/MobA/RfbA family)
MLRRALDAGRRTGCRLELASTDAFPLDADVKLYGQGRGTFGVRFERALAAGFDRNRGPIVVVGSDVPELDSRHITQALAHLKDDPERIVIGPSPDGGFYLLAASRPIEGLASLVSWCSRSTLRTLLAALRRVGRPVEFLEPLADLDRPADLEVWLARASEDWRAFVKTLVALLTAIRLPLQSFALVVKGPDLTRATPVRGSPPHAVES